MKLIIGAIAHGCAVMGLIGALLAGADGTARSANRNWHGVAEAKRLAWNSTQGESPHGIFAYLIHLTQEFDSRCYDKW